MRILGVDTGIRSAGYAVLNKRRKIIDYGVLKTSNSSSLEERLMMIYKGLKKVIAKNKPDIAVYERIFYQKNPSTLILMAQARGVLLLAAQELGVKVHEITPAEIKQVITGNGRASKAEVRSKLETILGKKVAGSYHVSDAVACVLCYLLKEVHP
ncbi:MAG TPA: crossover junction endodeoxyribonuclease RuvC [bacterium (Candidatus Stahlbacteria)]|nr:crossover junction endodeoxyribonuclease RuvC [Candidatus Stahlbacteria bacterium]